MPQGEGNCAQYSAMNAAKICHSLGLGLNELVQDHYDVHPDMNPNTVERDLIIPLILDAQDGHNLGRMSLNETRKMAIVEEISEKLTHPRKSLDNVNAVLLLQEMLCPEGNMQRLIFDANELQRPDNFGAYLIASHGNHQQVLMILGGTGILIDTLSENVVTAFPKDVALQNLAERIRTGSVPWSFYVPVSER